MKMPEKKEEPVMPSRETLRKAVILDLDAAIYFLHALKEHPDLLNELSDKLHERYTRGASLIDQVAKSNGDGTN